MPTGGGTRAHDPQRPPAAPELPEGYYAENFEVVLATVGDRYRDLLRGDETTFLDDWDALSLSARRLYVRLVSRKGPLFRRDRIEYAEIDDLDAAIRELDAAGFLDGAGDAPVEELLVLLLRGELLDLALELLPEGLRPAASARKPELFDAIAANVETRILDLEIRRRLEIVRPLGQDQVLVFRLLFFGNLRQDWTEFVLRDLGVLRFEPYDLRRELRLFPTRRALDDSLALQLCYREVARQLWLDELEEARETAASVLSVRPSRESWHPVARRYFDRICNRLGRHFERIANREETEAPDAMRDRALELYEAAAAPPARERRVRLLARFARLDEALSLCREIDAQPRDETEVEFAPRFAVTLRRRLGETVVRRRPRRPTLERSLERCDGVAVETLALEALEGEGRVGFFSENWLWRTLFGLAFWDVVFAPIEGAFLHPFQYGPLDLATPEFRKARADLVERRLAELRAEAWPAPRLLAVYDAKYNTANRLVAWGEAVRPRLEMALEYLTGEHLACVCDRLSRDVERYRRGLPDLFVLRDAEPGFELLEVKAPGDQLRPEQGAWIDYLNAHGVPARILRLKWTQP